MSEAGQSIELKKQWSSSSDSQPRLSSSVDGMVFFPAFTMADEGL
jgi:hypothetical protein